MDETWPRFRGIGTRTENLPEFQLRVERFQWKLRYDRILFEANEFWHVEYFNCWKIVLIFDDVRFPEEIALTSEQVLFIV